MKHISELRKNMTDEQKKRSDELYKELLDYMSQFGDPLLLLSACNDDIKYVKKIDLGKK